jgi:flagellar basal-body rod modification protein FlgD
MTDLSMLNGPASALSSSASTIGSSSTTSSLSNQQFSTDLFLQLLVTQLRYQDPMSGGGQDPGEMITQLSTFTMLEQIVKLQQTVEQMAFAQSNQQALGLLNQQVEVTGIDGLPTSGTVKAVEFREVGPYITVGDYDYPLSSLIRVEGGDDE